MKKINYLEQLISQKIFRLDHLNITGIDNEPIVNIFSKEVLEQEVCLFANTIASGNEYFHFLHNKIINSLREKKSLPIARFADGEYAFYNYTLDCNGLYQQAESLTAIKKAMPEHITAIKYLEKNGLIAPLVFPGNSIAADQTKFPFIGKKKDSAGADFLNFLQEEGINLTPDNYIPFYVVYAYLSSAEFALTINGKNVCILNSEYDEDSCYNWFTQFESHPILSFIDIPAKYIATRWEDIKNQILNKIPQGADMCLIGAGAGALLVCKDIAQIFSMPAIDAGHVLNMMNDRVDKSNGVRLYTLRK